LFLTITYYTDITVLKEPNNSLDYVQCNKLNYIKLNNRLTINDTRSTY